MLPRIESLHHLSTVSHVAPQGHARCVRLRINGNIAPRSRCSYPAKGDANAKADDPNNNGVLPFVQELHLADPPRCYGPTIPQNPSGCVEIVARNWPHFLAKLPPGEE